MHLINQRPLQHETVETCICSDGACSYTSLIIINWAWKKDGGACTGYCAIFLMELISWSHRVHSQGREERQLVYKTLIYRACQESLVT